MNPTILCRIALLLLCYQTLILPGCARSPAANYYTLAPVLFPDAPKTAPSTFSIFVTAVTLPELVDRPQLVRSSDGPQVQILEFHRWAEPLRSSIPRVIADNLSRLLGTDRVSAYPQNNGINADYRVVTDFQRFEASDSSVTLDALWSVRNPSGETVRSGRTRIIEQVAGRGESELMEAYGKALGGLSRDIACSVPQGPVCSK